MAYLTDEERQQMRKALMDRFNVAQNDTSTIDAAQGSADNADLIAGIGQSLEGLGRANSMARGGAGVNTAVYDAIRKSAQDKVKTAKDTQSSKLDALKTEGGFVNDILTGELNDRRQTADDEYRRKDLGLKQQELNLKEKEMGMKGPQVVGPNNIPIKEIQTDVEDLNKKQVVDTELAGKLKETAAQLDDPNKTPDEKLAIANASLQLLNNAIASGSNAVGAEEAARLGASLKSSISQLSKFGAGGAAGGAAIGAGLGSAVPVVGTAIGGALGTAIGGLGGLATGLFEESNRPGGVRLKPNVEEYNTGLKNTIDMMSKNMSRTDKIISLRRQGLSTTEAAKIVDGEVKQDFLKQN